MVNNLNKILPLLEFSGEDDFYYLQILQRKKDMTSAQKLTGTNNNARTIKNYFINSKEYLISKMPEIVELCKLFDARASIRLNKRSYKKVGFRTLQKIAGTMANGEYKHLRNSYSKSCGTGHNAGKNKTWIIDVDEDLVIDKNLINHINSLQPENNGYKVLPLYELEDIFESTFPGMVNEKTYLVLLDNGEVRDFKILRGEDGIFKTIKIGDITTLHEKVKAIIPSKTGYHLISSPFNIQKFEYKDLDIHKDNPTNLYIP